MSPRQTDNPRIAVVSARMTYAEWRRVIRALKQKHETASAMVRRVLLEASTK